MWSASNFSSLVQTPAKWMELAQFHWIPSLPTGCTSVLLCTAHSCALHILRGHTQATFLVVSAHHHNIPAIWFIIWCDVWFWTVLFITKVPSGKFGNWPHVCSTWFAFISMLCFVQTEQGRDTGLTLWTDWVYPWHFCSTEQAVTEGYSLSSNQHHRQLYNASHVWHLKIEVAISENGFWDTFTSIEPTSLSVFGAFQKTDLQKPWSTGPS